MFRLGRRCSTTSSRIPISQRLRPDTTKPEQVQAYNQTMIEINRAASGALIFGTPAVRDAVYEWLELMNSPDAPEVGSKDSAVVYRDLIEAIRADIESFRE